MRRTNIVLARTPELAASLRAAAIPSADPLEATRSVLWIAIAVRKLSEAGALPAGVLRRQWPVHLHPRRHGAPPSALALDAAYELSITRRDSIATLRLCGLLIHCAVFAATEGGVYFTSHFEKQHGLYFVDWAVIGRMVDSVCDEAAMSGVMHAA